MFLEFKHLHQSSISWDGKVFPGWVYLPQLCLQSPSLLPDPRDDQPQLLHRAPVLRDARLPHPESLPQITHLQLFESWTIFYPGTSDCYWTTQLFEHDCCRMLTMTLNMTVLKKRLLMLKLLLTSSLRFRSLPLASLQHFVVKFPCMYNSSKYLAMSRCMYLKQQHFHHIWHIPSDKMLHVIWFERWFKLPELTGQSLVLLCQVSCQLACLNILYDSDGVSWSQMESDGVLPTDMDACLARLYRHIYLCCLNVCLTCLSTSLALPSVRSSVALWKDQI